MLVRVEGRVRELRAPRPIPSGSPEAFLFRKPRGGFSMAVDRWGEAEQALRGPRGVVDAWGDGLPGDITAGTRVAVTGMFRPISAPSNPGEPDWRARAAQEGRLGFLSANSGAVQRVGPRGRADALFGEWQEFRARWREKSRGLLQRAGASEGSRTGPLLSALVLGADDPNARDVRETFRDAGVAHLTAISGFHVAVLFMLMVGVVRLSGDRPRLEAAVTVGLLFLVAAFIPTRAPIVRALAMVAAAFVPRMLGRRYDTLTVLGWITLALLIWRPLDVFSLGFQLTIGITALLVWLLDARHPWATPSDSFARTETVRSLSWRGGIGAAGRTTAVFVLCWLAGAPLIAWHTGALHWPASLAALAATPPVTVALAMGYAAVLFAPLSEGAAHLLAGGAHHAAGAALWVIDGANALPASSLRLPPLSIAWVIAATGCVVWFIRAADGRNPKPWAALAAIGLWLGVETHFASRLGPHALARVDMLDVGDGSCLLVRSGSDAILWDCGSLRPGMGRRAIPDALRSLGATRVPTAIITHNNVDHYGALPEVADDIGLERVFVSAPALRVMRRSDGAPRALLSSLGARGVAIEPLARGDAVSLGGASLEILWPPIDRRARGLLTQNDRSLVARIDVQTRAGPRSMLLCGDIETAAIAELLRDPTQLDADVLELPHHGSFDAAAAAFVRAASPMVVLQSTGFQRLGDHRWDGAKRRIAERDGHWWITAADAAAWAAIDRSGQIRTGSIRGRPERFNR